MNQVRGRRGDQFRISPNFNNRVEVYDAPGGRKGWYHFSIARQGLTIVSLRPSEAYPDYCECLCSDNRWYYARPDSMELTREERSNEGKANKEKNQQAKQAKSGPSLMATAAGAILDAKLAHDEQKAAEMKAEREEWQAERAAERERRKENERAEFYSRSNMLKEQYGTLGYDYTVGRVIRALVEGGVVKYGENLSQCDRVEPSEIIPLLKKVIVDSPKSEAEFDSWIKTLLIDPSAKKAWEWEEEFKQLFPDPERARQIRRRLESARDKAQERILEAKEKAQEKQDRKDQRELQGRWDITKVKKNKYVALLFAIPLGLLGGLYFYKNEKFEGFLTLGLFLTSLFTFALPLMLVLICWWLYKVVRLVFTSDVEFKKEFLPLYELPEVELTQKEKESTKKAGYDTLTPYELHIIQSIPD